MTETNITHDYIREYLWDIEPKDEGLTRELEIEAEETDVPIIPLEVKSLLTTLLEMKRPKRILEIGTAIGYSAIVMSKYLREDGSIDTIERNPVMMVRAEENIKKAGLEDCITMHKGTAEEILPLLEGPYDFVFIDAAKGQYKLFFELTKDMLAPEGIIMADNVLHKGMVAKERLDIPRRQRTIHSRMQTFFHDILHSEEFKSSVLPIGDGVAICYKRRQNNE